MLELVLDALRATLPRFELTGHAVNCHHNYVAREHHFGAEVYVTRARGRFGPAKDRGSEGQCR